jgi:hypothetical protein
VNDRLVLINLVLTGLSMFCCLSYKYLNGLESVLNFIDLVLSGTVKIANINIG